MVKEQQLIINGGRKTEGEIRLQGSKNSTLPILSASLLCERGECVLDGCPRITDVDASCSILRHIGVKVRREGCQIITEADSISCSEIPAFLMRKMRSSIIFLGPLLARCKRCTLSLPGGCQIGLRPIDIHISALKQLGVRLSESHGNLEFSAPDGLIGARLMLPFPSVGATENILLASVTAKGVTEITGGAREPEISDLAAFLNKCGAKIQGAGSDVITVEGVPSLHGCIHKVITDRIAAATLMCCAAVTGGELIISGADISHNGAVVQILREMGCRIYRIRDDRLYIKAPRTLSGNLKISTMPYPAFPTDSQAILMALSATARGSTMFIENIFDGRLRHIDELVRMGAKIRAHGNIAVVEGVECLQGAEVEATDLRAGAALVVAGLGAEGKTTIRKISHIDRGYEAIETTLRSIGADIRRTEQR